MVVARRRRSPHGRAIGATRMRARITIGPIRSLAVCLPILAWAFVFEPYHRPVIVTPFPSADEVVCPLPEIRVGLRGPVGRGQMIALAVDGIDVTQDTGVVDLLIWPGRVLVYYLPKQPLPPGSHLAIVSF